MNKRTTLGLLESTLHNFNCAKVENKFKTADDFISFLLGSLAKANENAEELTLKPTVIQKVYKDPSFITNTKKMVDKNNEKREAGDDRGK